MTLTLGKRAHRAIESLGDYIEVSYDSQRLHSTIGYRTPAEVERDRYKTTQAAYSTCPRNRITLSHGLLGGARPRGSVIPVQETRKIPERTDPEF